MLGIKCRLCSSSSTLISLFNGKSREIRDCIRKLVENTMGIKFQKDDAVNYICYSCTVQVYNFYIFKTRSLENEKLLEAHRGSEETKSHKFEILDLDNIELPDINKLQDSLSPWLLSKHKYCQSIDGECDNYKTSIETPEQNSILSDKQRTVENSTQCDTVESTDSSIQCDLPKSILHKSTQSDAPKPSLNKFTQCKVPHIEIHTQTNGILTKSSKIQCSLIPGELVNHKTPKKDSITQTILSTVDKSTQHVNNCDEICTEIDCKCHIHKLATIKQELEPFTPTNHLYVNVTPSKSPIAIISPNSTDLLAVKNKSQKVYICQECDQTLYSTTSYKLHKKSHMVCNFCKKKFPSRKRTKLHIENECDVKKLIKIEPVVQLVRLERLRNVISRYPKCLDILKKTDKSQLMMRMRSRSTSSVESSYSNCSRCSLCKSGLTMLHGLTMGVDQSVQTNLWTNNPSAMDMMISDHIPKAVVKSKLGNGEATAVASPPKKIKLAQTLVK